MEEYKSHTIIAKAKHIYKQNLQAHQHLTYLLKGSEQTTPVKS